VHDEGFVHRDDRGLQRIGDTDSLCLRGQLLGPRAAAGCCQQESEQRQANWMWLRHDAFSRKRIERGRSTDR
jgi:hypothetical protein